MITMKGGKCYNRAEKKNMTHQEEMNYFFPRRLKIMQIATPHYVTQDLQNEEDSISKKEKKIS